MKTIILTLSLFFFGISILYAQSFEIKEQAAWVKPIPVPSESTVSKYEVNGGVYNSLLDYQVNIDEEADFSHYVQSIVSQSGVSDASELYIAYDTSYQRVEFHYLHIWRNGKKIDKTADLSFEMLSNEQGLDSGIYSGQITAYDIIEDVRKGDKIELAYTIYGDNPIFEGKYFRLMPLEDINPVDHFYYRLSATSKKPLQYNCSRCEEMEVKEYEENGVQIIEIKQDHLETADYETTIPEWTIPYKYFMISGFKDWKEIGNWAFDVFKLDKIPNLDDVFSEIFHGDETIEEKMDAIINYVQDDIRYMGIESGIGSFKPFQPEQVVKQRYGDCKDKSLLMSALFNQIGVKHCYPALVSTSLTKGVGDFLPTGQLFNHCIVYFEYKGKSYWIDPTFSYQGGHFNTTSMIDYGKSLVIRPNSTDLTDMNVDDKMSRVEIDENINIPSFVEPGTIQIVTKLYGLKADYTRSVLEYSSIKELSDKYKSIYAALYPSIQVGKKLIIKDDEDKNVITLVENYTIENLWRTSEAGLYGSLDYQYEPIGLYDFIGTVACDVKKYDVEVPYPIIFKQTTTMKMPDRLEISGEEEIFENAAFNFKKTTKQVNDRTLRLDYSYQTITDVIAKEQFKDICLDMNTISNNLPLSISFPKTRSLKTE